MKKRTMFILAVLMLVVSIVYSITILTLTGMAVGTVGITIMEPLYPPENIICTVDNSTILLNWTNSTTAEHYVLYYSSNISAITSLNPNNVPDDVIVVNNLSDNSWLDDNASDDWKRYYTIGSVRSTVTALSYELPIGKFTYNYTVPSSTNYGILASQWISLYLNVSFDAEEFMSQIPSSYNPTLSRFDKSDSSGEFFVTHVKGLLDGHNFNMEIAEGYQVSIDQPFNHTICGNIYNPPYILEHGLVNSSNWGPLATSFKGIFDSNKSYDAEAFVQQIPLALNPTISRLDKSDLSGEYLTTHVGGLDDNNNYTMKVGSAYWITVDQSYNQTLCTNCFD